MLKKIFSYYTKKTTITVSLIGIQFFRKVDSSVLEILDFRIIKS